MPRASGRRSQLEEEWWGGGREEVLVGWGLMILVARTGNLCFTSVSFHTQNWVPRWPNKNEPMTGEMPVMIQDKEGESRE